MTSFAWLSFLITSTDALAKPVVGAAKAGAGEIVMAIDGDKLFWLVGGIALNLIVQLGAIILNRGKRDLEEIKAAVKHIPLLTERVEEMDEHLKKNVPTHEAVDLRILRFIHERRGKDT